MRGRLRPDDVNATNGDMVGNHEEQLSEIPTYNVFIGGIVKKNDIVNTRETDPTRLKRGGTSLTCSNCNEWGHNIRSCKIKFIYDERKEKEEGGRKQGDEEKSKHQKGETTTTSRK
ncbi:hypothetical protein POM88_023043 [Heracleum sosnowskyi]|uniref:CCHC-type domain-containing protein n=1 Tax=Heracleum sosnowskyi TaxID=360622 RepID=A0AAD8MVF4_9APIA|nr:hypothetical protein POM88_023043 [Heracleum sosnowskyi]